MTEKNETFKVITVQLFLSSLLNPVIWLSDSIKFGESKRRKSMFSGTVKILDIDDYIKPSQECNMPFYYYADIS